MTRPARPPAALRPARDEDAPGLVAPIAACWAEYPGCVMDLDGENPELRRFASHCAERRGAAWVAERDAGEPATQVAKDMGMSRATLYRRIKDADSSL